MEDTNHIAINEKTIEVTIGNYKALKKAYNRAVTNKEEEFTFNGSTLLVSYAKYVLEYMAILLKLRPDGDKT